MIFLIAFICAFLFTNTLSFPAHRIRQRSVDEFYKQMEASLGQRIDKVLNIQEAKTGYDLERIQIMSPSYKCDKYEGRTCTYLRHLAAGLTLGVKMNQQVKAKAICNIRWYRYYKRRGMEEYIRVELTKDIGILHRKEKLPIHARAFMDLPLQSVSFEWSIKGFKNLPKSIKIIRDQSSVIINKYRAKKNHILVCSVFSNKGIFVARRNFLLRKTDTLSTKYPAHSSTELNVKRRHKRNTDEDSRFGEDDTDFKLMDFFQPKISLQVKLKKLNSSLKDSEFENPFRILPTPEYDKINQIYENKLLNPHGVDENKNMFSNRPSNSFRRREQNKDKSLDPCKKYFYRRGKTRNPIRNSASPTPGIPEKFDNEQNLHRNSYNIDFQRGQKRLSNRQSPNVGLPAKDNMYVEEIKKILLEPLESFLTDENKDKEVNNELTFDEKEAMLIGSCTVKQE
ncbi:hypothetical protein JTE90_002034 [Oedothorax gibbosus]|uniref:Uncharacterized protein n=1 Tax=Oedothorax gibbosus TaxID=931172 RepID=A0AAV6UNE8_9ARAC|nr:hypothetical protein JTE90_002034 [Oedothorax gibbosus]